MSMRRRTLYTWFLAGLMAVAPASPASTASSIDAGAGTWRMIALTGPTQFVVAPPAQVTSFEYQSELNAIPTSRWGRARQAHRRLHRELRANRWSRPAVTRLIGFDSRATASTAVL